MNKILEAIKIIVFTEVDKLRADVKRLEKENDALKSGEAQVDYEMCCDLLETKIKNLKIKLEISKSFHDVAVKERDLEILRVNNLTKELNKFKISSNRLFQMCLFAYLKHHYDHQGIGWDELSSRLHDELCNFVGADKATIIIDKEMKKENPLDIDLHEFDRLAIGEQ